METSDAVFRRCESMSVARWVERGFGVLLECCRNDEAVAAAGLTERRLAVLRERIESLRAAEATVERQRFLFDEVRPASRRERDRAFRRLRRTLEDLEPRVERAVAPRYSFSSDTRPEARSYQAPTTR